MKIKSKGKKVAETVRPVSSDTSLQWTNIPRQFGDFVCGGCGAQQTAWIYPLPNMHSQDCSSCGGTNTLVNERRRGVSTASNVVAVKFVSIANRIREKQRLVEKQLDEQLRVSSSSQSDNSTNPFWKFWAKGGD